MGVLTTKNWLGIALLVFLTLTSRLGTAEIDTRHPSLAKLEDGCPRRAATNHKDCETERLIQERGVSLPGNHVLPALLWRLAITVLPWIIFYPAFGWGFFGLGAPQGTRPVLSPTVSPSVLRAWIRNRLEYRPTPMEHLKSEEKWKNNLRIELPNRFHKGLTPFVVRQALSNFENEGEKDSWLCETIRVKVNIAFGLRIGSAA